MSKLISLIFVFSLEFAVAQTTTNPKIERKSTNDTFINKIEITDDYTVVSMQYVSRSAKETVRDYLNDNPKVKEQLGAMPLMLRDMQLQQMMQGMGGNNTISIQPSSYLEATDGKRFEYIKASNIPVAPQTQNVVTDKKYFFKVFFEKLDSGVESIDFVEGNHDREDGMQYWNFYGIAVNNPAGGKVSKTTATSETEFILRGKVFDAETNKPISAKIVCLINGEEMAFDSVQTSRTGYYEFLMKPQSYVYTITADGYEVGEESFDLSNLKTSKSFPFDIFLEPIGFREEEARKEMEIEEEVPIGIEEPAEIEDIELVNENRLRLNHVYFPTGKAEILMNSYDELEKVVKMMKKSPEMKIRIDGHTDNQGDSRLNRVLSLDRAKNVRDFLVENGIEEARISFKGWGDTKPLESNGNDVSRQQNRRVEIVILEQ